MKRKRKREWEKSETTLAPNHGYRAKPGSKVFIIDRGAVRFDPPGDWIVEPRDNSCVLKTPEDDCSIEITHYVLPPVPIDWNKLPLNKLLRDMARVVGREITDAEIVRVERPGMEIGWYEYTYLDPSEDREAIGRTCFARTNHFAAVISYAFWPEVREKYHAVWEEILRTLTFGNRFDDPRIGPRLQ